MSTRAKNIYCRGAEANRKDRGLKGYSNLRKQELLDLVFPTSLLDEPDIKTPILQPSMFGKAKNAQKVKNEWIKWTNWLLDHIPEKPKVDEVLESFKRQILHLRIVIIIIIVMTLGNSAAMR